MFIFLYFSCYYKSSLRLCFSQSYFLCRFYSIGEKVMYQEMIYRPFTHKHKKVLGLPFSVHSLKFAKKTTSQLEKEHSSTPPEIQNAGRCVNPFGLTIHSFIGSPIGVIFCTVKIFDVGSIPSRGRRDRLSTLMGSSFPTFSATRRSIYQKI